MSYKEFHEYMQSDAWKKERDAHYEANKDNPDGLMSSDDTIPSRKAYSKQCQDCSRFHFKNMCNHEDRGDCIDECEDFQHVSYHPNKKINHPKKIKLVFNKLNFIRKT